MVQNKIIWIGPMSGGPIAYQAAEARDYVLKPACAENSLTLQTPDLVGSGNWLQELLNAISTSLGVVCDISDTSPNVFLELGYVLALKIPILLISQDDTTIPVDLANYQVRKYKRLNDLAQPIRNWLIKLLSPQEPLLSRLSTTLPHPFHLFEGDGQREYMNSPRSYRRPFKISVDDSKDWTLSGIANECPSTKELIHKVHHYQKTSADRSMRPFFNGSLFGYVKHKPQRDELGITYGAEITCASTDYYAFTATHFYSDALDEALHRGDITETECSKIRAEINDLVARKEWPYVQALSIGCFVKIEYADVSRLVIQRRDIDRNFHARYCLQASAAGMIHPARVIDNTLANGHDIALAFCHELSEETGLQFAPTDVRILGLVQEITAMECGFMGYVSATPELISRGNLASDQFESKGFELVDLVPERMIRFLRENANLGSAISPMSLAGLSLMLIHEFGSYKAAEILREGTRRG